VFRPAAALPRASVAAAILLLAACAGGAALLPADPTARLVSRGLEDIARYYIRPVSDRKLILATAQGLHRLDSQVTVSEIPGSQAELALEYGARQLAVHPEPAADDMAGWGVLAGRLVAEAKAASPVLARLSEDKIDTALLGGMTSALDPFSRYSPPEEASEDDAMRDGFGGVGLTVAEQGGNFLVTQVLPRGPADVAGVRPQDRIVGIDGVPTAGKPQEAVVDALRGPVGRPVELAVYRPSVGRERDFRIRRQLIVLPTVTVERDGGIFVFRIASFNESTAHIVKKTLAAAKRAGGLAGVVLDLRGDPGGLLSQAVALADIFLDKGPIASTIGRNPASRQYFAAAGDAIARKVPIVVLIDGSSASAAEIVASALQDVGRAVVVGSASYGKGTVQTVLDLPNHGELILTWAFVITPSGYFLNLHGVVPTVCTSDLADGPSALEAGLQRAAAPASAELSSRPRASLDGRQWLALRASCPPRLGKHPIDLEVAKRLVSDPALYGEAVRLIAPAPKLAATPASAGTASGTPAAGARLTPPERSLLSNPR
jgi:carboxyl-terminal processing protease